MRKTLVLASLACLVLASCGSKRRASLEKGRQAGRSQTQAAGDNARAGLPEEEEFRYFPIHSPEEYIATFGEIAKNEMVAYGIPASITIAQGLLESGFGQGELTRKTNNHFGIKCHTGWEGDYAHHDDDEKGECFRKYNHPMYSFRDHSIFLTSRSRYASLFELRRNDYRGWARGLKEAGYATDRRYPHKLIELIERYNLARLDKEVLGEETPVYTEVAEAGDSYETYRVQAGDTLYAISRRYRVSVEELMRLNQLSSSAISIGQLLKVRPDNTNR